MQARFRTTVPITAEAACCRKCGKPKQKTAKKADVPIEKTAWFKRGIEEDRQLKRAAAERRANPPKPYDLALGRSIFDPPHLKTAATLKNGEAPKPYDIALGRSIFDSPTAARETA